MEYAGISPFHSLFVQRHLNRKYVNQVKHILDATKIETPINEVLEKLDEIKLSDQTCELAKRIHYIRYYLAHHENLVENRLT